MTAMVGPPRWVRGASSLAVVLLTGLASPAWSAACDAVFTNGAQSHSPGGSINADFQTEITGGGSQLDTPSLTTGSQVTCGGSGCSASGTPAATGDPAFEVGSGADGDINAAGSPGNTTNVSEGDYTSVSVVQQRTLSFSTSGGTYLMESLTSNFQSEVRFSAGDYWIDGDMTIRQETDLVMQGGGTVRIFVDGNVSLGFQVESLGFSPDQLLIYATGNITLTGNQVRLSGFLYAGGQFQSSFQSEISGGVSGASVDLENETSIQYAGGVLGTADFAPFCGGDGNGVDPELVYEWRMDESAWSGTSGEVLDQSGNGNHGTAQGDAGTDDTSPATPGDPGTCGYGQFDGSGDYVSVPGLSNTLNATASLAFWIRTTQVGNDTIWQAPGVTGVEEAGGTDDIFWGWLDSQGHIGVSVANDSSTKSQASINDGNWHHVVLTRDHLAGEFRIYIDGGLDNDGSIASGVIGNGYDRIGSIMDTAGSHEYLNGHLDEVRVYDGVLELDEVQLIRDATHPCPGAICPNATAEPGLMGNYYDTQDLDSVRDGPPTATRVDGPIEFTWNDDDGPSVLGQGSDFSILWNGKLLVTQSGNYEFTVVSDDGVRLLLDGQLLIEEWYDHDDQAFDSAPQSLQAGQVYDLQLEYYENQGDADIELYWSRTGGGPPMNQQLIPAGNVQGTAAGLYHCPQTAVAYYTLEHGTIGLTCEAQLVTITARDSNGDAMAPQSGTEIELSVSPSSSGASWVGGNFYIFSGEETFIERYLTHTEPTAVTPEVLETTGSASGVGGEIDFVDLALRFYGNRNVDDPLNPPPVAGQVAGRPDQDPVLRVVRTDDETGVCEPEVTSQDWTVALAFECRNPTQCIAGQTLTLNNQAVMANDRNTGPAYTSFTLSFDNDGFASIPLEYSDVGQVRLHGQVEVPVENDPNREDIVTGDSNSFVVRPYTLAVTAVTDDAGADAPGWGANSGQDPESDGFVAAGETFAVTVEARNERGQLTPNFGNETTPESAQLATPPILVYPAGGATGTLANAVSFSRSGPGQFTADTLTWDNVGAIALTPQLDSDGYLGTGALVSTTLSNTVGRFYPWNYAVIGSGSTDTCTSFSYLQQPEVGLSVTLEALNLGGTKVTNYDTDLGYQQVAAPAASGHVAENADSGNGNVFDGRVQATFEGDWDHGTGQFDTNTAMVGRAAQPDGPWPSLRIGLTALTDPDNRPLVGHDMNADTTGDCTAADDCNAVALGATLEFRFGRLRLENAFGPEVIDLPAPFYIEYWNGTEFIRNADDSCSRIPRSAITYEPTGTLADDNNRTVPIGGGTTTGQYDNLDSVGVNINTSYSGQTFTAPGEGNTGSFDILVNLTDRPWLIFDWNQDGDHNNDVQMPPANVGFGSYRGHDRIIYWREVLE